MIRGGIARIVVLLVLVATSCTASHPRGHLGTANSLSTTTSTVPHSTSTSLSLQSTTSLSTTPSLAVSVSAPSTVKKGQQFALVFRVQANGSPFSSVELDIDLAFDWIMTAPDCNGQAAQFRCDIGALGANRAAQEPFTVTAENSGPITQSAKVTGNVGTSPSSGTGSATVVVTQ